MCPSSNARPVSSLFLNVAKPVDISHQQICINALLLNEYINSRFSLKPLYLTIAPVTECPQFA